ncbi:hypothetical protein AMATHDRAFT_51343 [Amanita thiersii Skay4041]|uniref:F-box domain-containing protein n=1 Tax=Amanita thiersii Skay4041 TaxID=703135 RepID=A0A2A9NCL4_9AGAR|nr:hypothetical protein AMATHDRAFT_51343 [Amanita thiersii Skay4041]
MLHTQKPERAFIHQLPPEVLLVIFCTLLDTNYNETIFIPFMLSQVCAKWRQIVLSTPSLWARIHVPLDSKVAHAHQVIARCLPLLFERSETTPLTISYLCDDYQGQEGTLGCPLLPLILGQIHRWGQVILMIRSPDVSFMQVNAPCLREFVMECAGDSDAILFPFTSCPSLVRLSWPWSMTLPGKHGPIIWSQMEELETDTTSLNNALNFLEWSTKLIKYQFYLEKEQVNFIQKRLVVNHSLQRLNVTGLLRPLLESIILPQLTHLELHGNIDGLPRLLARSPCSLRSLIIKFNGRDFFKPLELADILFNPCCSSLTKLDIYYVVRLTDNLLEKMTYSSSSSSISDVLCPNLTYVKLHTCYCSPGLFGRMIESRFTHVGSHLEQFYYHDYFMGKGISKNPRQSGLSQEDVDILLSIPNVKIDSWSKSIAMERKSKTDW